MKFEPLKPKAQVLLTDNRQAPQANGTEAATPGIGADVFQASAGLSRAVGGLGNLTGKAQAPANHKGKAKVHKPHHWSKRHPMPTTPKGQAMVLSANLREGLVVDPGDVAHTRDMKNFVDRVARLVPYAPDVLTLAEVIGPSAQNVARLLSARTGHHYVVVAAPGASPYGPGPMTHDSAILVNADTFHVEKRGFITTPTPHGHHNQQATALIRQKGSHLRLNLAAVHYPTTGAFNVSRDEADRVRGRQGREDHAYLERQEGHEHAINIIAGDYNNTRNHAGHETPLYRSLEARHYHDSVREKSPEHVHRGNIDYIFTQGNVVDADTDYTYTREMKDSGFRNHGAIDPATHDKREKTNPKYYYSDHAFEWAIVGKPHKKKP